jgi:hypothetical protein
VTSGYKHLASLGRNSTPELVATSTLNSRVALQQPAPSDTQANGLRTVM